MWALYATVSILIGVVLMLWVRNVGETTSIRRAVLGYTDLSDVRIASVYKLCGCDGGLHGRGVETMSARSRTDPGR
jgi:hypothetical protein